MIGSTADRGDQDCGRSLTDILAVLATESMEVAEFARFLDDNISEILGDGRTPQDRLTLQNVDRLHQHLDEIARALNWLAVPGRIAGSVDASALSAHMRLGHFRTRLGGAAPQFDRRDPAGDVELF